MATAYQENQSKLLFHHQKESSYVQSLSVNINIPVPADTVIISRVELQELKKLQLTGVYWSMKDLENRVNRKSEWIKENILYPTRFKKLLRRTVDLYSTQKAKDKPGHFRLQRWPSF